MKTFEPLPAEVTGMCRALDFCHDCREARLDNVANATLGHISEMTWVANRSAQSPGQLMQLELLDWVSL